MSRSKLPDIRFSRQPPDERASTFVRLVARGNKRQREGVGMTQRKADSGQYALYRPQFEHDNCGFGAVVNIMVGKSLESV